MRAFYGEDLGFRGLGAFKAQGFRLKARMLRPWKPCRDDKLQVLISQGIKACNGKALVQKAPKCSYGGGAELNLWAPHSSLVVGISSGTAESLSEHRRESRFILYCPPEEASRKKAHRCPPHEYTMKPSIASDQGSS